MDTWESHKVFVDSLNLKFEYECKSKHMPIWMGLEVALFALILLWGLLVVYSTWKVKESIHESRWLLLSIYNLVVVLAILIPLFSTLNVTDNTMYYISGLFSSQNSKSQVPAICFATTNLVFSVFIPVVAKKFYSSYTSYRTRSSEKRKASSKGTANSKTGTERTKTKTKSISKFKIQGENGTTIVEIKDPQREVELPEVSHRESRMSQTSSTSETSEGLPSIEATIHQ